MMKVWKLVAGIISIVLSAFVIFQSCAAGMANAMENNGGVSGTAGMLVAILLMVGGIVSIATRNGHAKGGNIALVVVFGLAALIGFALHGNYSDLVVWACWCLINAALAVVAMVKARPGNDNPEQDGPAK